MIVTTDREAMPGSRRFSHRSCFREWLYGTPAWNPGEIVLAARFGDQRIPIRTETSDDGMRRFRPSTEVMLSVIEPSAATYAGRGRTGSHVSRQQDWACLPRISLPQGSDWVRGYYTSSGCERPQM